MNLQQNCFCNTIAIMAAPMESDSSTDIPKIDWLYPELLSKEGLIEILSQRFVKLPEDLEATTKDSLLELYCCYILPRPQRQYRLNRRGREMTRKQVIQAKKRKATEKISSEPAAKKSAGNSSQLLTSFDGISLGNRLKPPPSCINFQKKVIKLGSSKSSGSDDVSSSGSHGDSSSSSSGSTVIKLSKTSTKTAESEAKSASASKTITLNKTVKLINSHLSSPGSGDAGGDKMGKNNTDMKISTRGTEEKVDTQESPSPPKKAVKIKRIAWP